MALPKKEQAGGNSSEQPSTSFRERKMAALSAESSGQEKPEPKAPTQAEEPAEQTLLSEDGSTEVVDETPENDVYAETDTDDMGALDPDNGTPDTDVDTPTEDGSWEKRYKDLQAEYTRLTQNREQVEKEQAQTAAETVRLQFELEDKLDEAVKRAEFLKNTMEGHANRFRNIDWSRVPPDKIQEVQAQAQQALAMQQQASAAFEHVQSEAKMMKEQAKRREAAIAKTRLSRTIPGWSPETYTGLRDFAVKSGMPAEAFNQITDPVIIEWAYAAQQIQNANAKGVANLTKPRKARAPMRRSAAKPQVRNERGQFSSKQVEPNQRGSFADKHKHRLAAERSGR